MFISNAHYRAARVEADAAFAVADVLVASAAEIQPWEAAEAARALRHTKSLRAGLAADAAQIVDFPPLKATLVAFHAAAKARAVLA